MSEKVNPQAQRVFFLVLKLLRGFDFDPNDGKKANMFNTSVLSDYIWTQNGAVEIRIGRENRCLFPISAHWTNH